MDFITAAECAAFLQVTPDATLTRLVSAVERDFMTACGRTFERQSFTSYLPGYGPRVDYTFAPEWPIHSIAEVRIDATGLLGADTTLDDPSVVVYSEQDGPKISYVGGWFPEGARVVRMTYEAGWYPYSDEDPLHADGRPPEDLRDRLIEEVVARYRRGASEAMQSENVAGIGGFVRFAPGQTVAFRQAVRRYRRIV